MLTKLTIRNFKRFPDVEIELGHPVAFIGPNNSGKTSAMQALALWDIGLKRWNEKRLTVTKERQRGVSINRRDLVAVPVPNAKLLWRDLHVREIMKSGNGQRTQNIRIDVIVEGVSENQTWECGLEFDFANSESFYCRPLRLDDDDPLTRMAIPDHAGRERIAFLPPMSGLSATETRLDEGAINVRVGEGRTAEVLRNLCMRTYQGKGENWRELSNHIKHLFGVELNAPRYIAERGEISMSYREKGVELDLSSSGRGLQQTLLILAYMYANPGAVLLLDEPDAHLEIIRQRQIYQLITEVARTSGGQIIAASHSEVLLNEAADKDMVVAFVGPKPHRIDRSGGSQVLKSLQEIGFEHFYQAEQSGWVLYLEGSTDLAILKALASRLGHTNASKALERPYIHYVGNQQSTARRHFYGLKEALPNLKGISIFDRIESGVSESGDLLFLFWRRREIENYLCSPETLMEYANKTAKEAWPGQLFEQQETERRSNAMRKAIHEVQEARKTLGQDDIWSHDVKASDDVLNPIFRRYFELLDMPNLMAKKQYYELALHVPEELIDSEILEKLDQVAEVWSSATPSEL